jgi:hypothetical protein
MMICKEITDSTCEHAQRSKGAGLRVAGAYARATGCHGAVAVLGSRSVGANCVAPMPARRKRRAGHKVAMSGRPKRHKRPKVPPAP